MCRGLLCWCPILPGSAAPHVSSGANACASRLVSESRESSASYRRRNDNAIVLTQLLSKSRFHNVHRRRVPEVWPSLFDIEYDGDRPDRRDFCNSPGKNSCPPDELNENRSSGALAPSAQRIRLLPGSYELATCRLLRWRSLPRFQCVTRWRDGEVHGGRVWAQGRR